MADSKNYRGFAALVFKQIDARREEKERIKDDIQQNKIPISSSKINLKRHNELLLFSKTKEMTEHLLDEYEYDIAFKDSNESLRTLLHNAVCKKATNVSKQHLEFIMDKFSEMRSKKFRLKNKSVQPKLSNGNTPLHEIFQQGATGKESLLKVYLAKSLEVNDSDEQLLFSLNDKNAKKQTPLHLCIMRGDVDLLKTLLDFSTTAKRNKPESKLCYLDVNCKDDRNWTPMHYAALHENPAFAEHLSKFGKKSIQLNEQNEAGRTPLLVALQEGNAKTAKVFYENPKTNINIKDGYGVSAFKYALNAEDKNREFVEFFLRKMFEKEEILDIAIKEGYTDNIWAKLENYDMRYMKSKYDPSFKEDLPPSNINLNELNGGETILHRAARFGNSGLIEKKIKGLEQRNEIEKELISIHRLSSNKRKKNSPLHIASNHGHVDSLLKLVEYVFELNKTRDNEIYQKAWEILGRKDALGDNFLQLAVKSNKIPPASLKEIFNAINEHEEDYTPECKKLYESTDKDNNTLLHNIIQKGKHSCATDLFDR